MGTSLTKLSTIERRKKNCYRRLARLGHSCLGEIFSHRYLYRFVPIGCSNSCIFTIERSICIFIIYSIVNQSQSSTIKKVFSLLSKKFKVQIYDEVNFLSYFQWARGSLNALEIQLKLHSVPKTQPEMTKIFIETSMNYLSHVNLIESNRVRETKPSDV